MSQNEWRDLTHGESRIEFETPLFRISQKDLYLNEEHLHAHYSLELGPAAVMLLASTSDNRWVINREYRPSVGRTLLSCPGGALDAGEEAIEAAERELLEETGYTAQGYSVMGVSYPFPGIASQRIYYVRAHTARLTHPPAREVGEFIETFEVDLPQLYKKINQGEAVDGNLCTALFWLSQVEK